MPEANTPEPSPKPLSELPPESKPNLPTLSELLFPKQELPEVTLRYSGRKEKGARYETCEDSLIIFGGHGRDGAERPLEGEANLLQEDLIVAVSDGMGGRAAGEIASQTVLETLAQAMPKAFQTAALGLDPDINGLLEESLNQANTRLLKMGQEQAHLAGLGATLTLGWFTPHFVHLAHIGDSRAYRLRAGKLELLTQDHSLVGIEYHAGNLNERQFRAHPRRNILTRAMGGGSRNILPLITTRRVKKGDRFLFCSDGLIDGLWDKQIHEELAMEASPSQLSAQMLAKAVQASGRDDTSLIVVAVE